MATVATAIGLVELHPLKLLQSTWSDDSASLTISGLKFRSLLPKYVAGDVEVLLNGAADLLERCLAVKRQAEDLWVKLAEFQLQTGIVPAGEEIQVSLDGIQERIDASEARRIEYEAFIVDREANQAASKVSEKYVGTADLGDRNGLRPNELINTSVTFASQAFTAGNQTGRELPYAGLAINDKLLALFQDDLSRQLRGLRAEYLVKGVNWGLRADDSSSLGVARLNAAEGTKLRAIRKAMGQDGGPLDYADRIKSMVMHQIVPDLNDAIEKVNSVHEGLATVFGWGGYPGVPSQEPEASSYIERLWHWTNGAIASVSRFCQHDQSCLVAIASSELEILEGSVAAGSFKFNMPLARFDHLSHCRLRGIRVSTVGVSKEAMFTVQLTPPKSAISLRTAEYAPINQEWARSFTIGRVVPWTDVRPTETFTGSSIVNISPIGDPADGERGVWQCSIKNVLGNGELPAALLIELIVNGQPRHIGALHNGQ